MSAIQRSIVMLSCDGGSGCLECKPVMALSVNAAREFVKKNEGWTSTVIDGVTRDYCRACSAVKKAVA